MAAKPVADLRRLAFLGLGTMGGPMAANLVQAGFEVRGYNRNPARAEPWRTRGIAICGTPEDAASGVDAIIVCLADDRAVRNTLLDSAVLDQLAAGGLIVDTGTTGLELLGEVERRADEARLELLDAPMTGSKLGAENGALTFMVGGPAARVARAAPLFAAMGKHTVHAGPEVGDGMRIKYCLNLSQAIVLQGILEGFALAEAQGLSLDTLAEVFENSAGKTGVGSFKTEYLRRGDFRPHFRLALMQKDLHHALAAAADTRSPLPLGRAVATIYDQAARAGWGDEDFLATAKLLGYDRGFPGPRGS